MRPLRCEERGCFQARDALTSYPSAEFECASSSRRRTRARSRRSPLEGLRAGSRSRQSNPPQLASGRGPARPGPGASSGAREQMPAVAWEECGRALEPTHPAVKHRMEPKISSRLLVISSNPHLPLSSIFATWGSPFRLFLPCGCATPSLPKIVPGTCYRLSYGRLSSLPRLSCTHPPRKLHKRRYRHIATLS